MPDNYEESTAKETNDKFSTEVNQEILNYDQIFKIETDDQLLNEVNETLEVYRNHDNRLEVSETYATCNEENEIKVKHLGPDENADARVFEDDEFEGQLRKPDVIKMLFKGAFSENSKEVLENLNKFKKIGFGRSYDTNRLEANFCQENQICVEAYCKL